MSKKSEINIKMRDIIAVTFIDTYAVLSFLNAELMLPVDAKLLKKITESGCTVRYYTGD